MDEAKIGIIGGSGLYQIEGLEGVRNVAVETPFGDPSDELILGELSGHVVAFLPRHGIGHRVLPHELNYRANIYAMKALGVEHILSVSAVGSMREDIEPLHVVLPDQFIDRTRMRVSTFFGDGLAAHVAFADPICPRLADILHESAIAAGATVHKGGVYLCMEGPQFSTRAESNLYRSWGVDIIGMTNLQEAKLAREAEICYATIALATDYDCWHEEEEDVSTGAILENLLKNVETAKAIIKDAVSKVETDRTCLCPTALESALISDPEAVPAETRERLQLIVGKYL